MLSLKKLLSLWAVLTVLAWIPAVISYMSGGQFEVGSGLTWLVAKFNSHV